jgi:hypothetical protein
MRSFARTDLGCEPVPDETTNGTFCRPLKMRDLGQEMFDHLRVAFKDCGARVGGAQRPPLHPLGRKFPMRSPNFEVDPARFTQRAWGLSGDRTADFIAAQRQEATLDCSQEH